MLMKIVLTMTDIGLAHLTRMVATLRLVSGAVRNMPDSGELALLIEEPQDPRDMPTPSGA